jgi:hypothetical protein
MSGSITFNPYATTTPRNPFVQQTQGYYQGFAMDEPSSRLWLRGGTLDVNETLTMWGGIPISQEIHNNGTGSEGLGPAVKRATTQASVTGFSVFNQASSMVIVPGNSVPLAGVGNYVSFYMGGSGQVRIAVKCDAALIAALTSGELINAPALYWDVTNYQITLTTTGGNFALPTAYRLDSTNTNSQVVNYNAGTVTWIAGDAALLLI